MSTNMLVKSCSLIKLGQAIIEEFFKKQGNESWDEITGNMYLLMGDKQEKTL